MRIRSRTHVGRGRVLCQGKEGFAMRIRPDGAWGRLQEDALLYRLYKQYRWLVLVGPNGMGHVLEGPEHVTCRTLMVREEAVTHGRYGH